MSVAATAEPRSLKRLLQTKEAITAIVAIIGAAGSLAAWGGNVAEWLRGNEKSPVPWHVVRPLSVVKDHIVLNRGRSFAVFGVDGEVDAVGGDFCIVRWRTYDGTNDQRLTGPMLAGRKAIALRRHVCLATMNFSIEAPSNAETLYVEVELVEEDGQPLGRTAKSEELILAQP